MSGIGRYLGQPQDRAFLQALLRRGLPILLALYIVDQIRVPREEAYRDQFRRDVERFWEVTGWNAGARADLEENPPYEDPEDNTQTWRDTAFYAGQTATGVHERTDNTVVFRPYASNDLDFEDLYTLIGAHRIRRLIQRFINRLHANVWRNLINGFRRRLN